MAGVASEHVKVRQLMIDWMIDIADDRDLSGHTIVKAITCMDALNSHLCLENLDSKQARATAAACLLIASKFEDVNAVSLQELCDETAMTAAELRDAELLVLQLLSFHIPVHPTFEWMDTDCHTFCKRLPWALILCIHDSNMDKASDIESAIKDPSSCNAYARVMSNPHFPGVRKIIQRGSWKHV